MISITSEHRPDNLGTQIADASPAYIARMLNSLLLQLSEDDADQVILELKDDAHEVLSRASARRLGRPHESGALVGLGEGGCPLQRGVLP